jgi:hypothetical protein
MHRFFIVFLGFFTGTSHAQSIDATIGTWIKAVGAHGLGKPAHQFLSTVASDKNMVTTTLDFRTEVQENIGANGIQDIQYYVVEKPSPVFYEIITRFDSPELCKAVAERLLRAPNYPGKPDYWIVGAAEGVVTLAWIFDATLVLATNVPGSEWAGDSLFQIPPGFGQPQAIAGMSRWTPDALNQFYTSLKTQVEAALTAFEPIKGKKLEGENMFECTQPLYGAETALIFSDSRGRRVAGNGMLSAATAEDAILWELDAEKNIGEVKFPGLTFQRLKSQKFGNSNITRWEVSLADGKPIDVQLGITRYETATKGAWNIDFWVISNR